VSTARTAPAATALAIALGVVLAALAYPPVRVPGLGLLLAAPIAWCIDGLPPRRAFACAWLYSTVFATWLCRWLVYALVTQYGVAPLPAWLFTLVVIGAFALVPAAAGAAYAMLRPAGAIAPVVFAAVWTLGEWLRGALLGVPWLLAVQTATDLPVLLQAADVGGQYLVSFALLAVGGGIGLAVRRRNARLLAWPAAIALVWIGYGAIRLATFDAHGAGAARRVGIVQASVPQAERFQPGSAVRNVARHEAATRKLATEGPLDLIVWSETAVDVDIDKAPATLRSLEALVDEIGVPLVTGAPRSEHGRPTNAVVLIAPHRGIVESYDKQRLVPFSEYDPPGFGWLAALIGPVVEGEPYVAGRDATVFRAGALTFSTPICFEITDSNLVSRFRAAGAALFVNLSNDAWFGPIGYPEMHLDHAILRAVEQRSTVVRGANTGISAVVDPTGRVVARQPAFTEGTLRVELTPAGPAPIYATTGDGLLVVALFIVVAAAFRRSDAAPDPGPRRSGSARRAAARDRAR
jgi:apolipoprotein N-acyltransferase